MVWLCTGETRCQGSQRVAAYLRSHLAQVDDSFHLVAGRAGRDDRQTDIYDSTHQQSDVSGMARQQVAAMNTE